MIRRGTRLRNKATDEIATVIYDDGQEVTILVDGYAASDAYDATELAEKWEPLVDVLKFVRPEGDGEDIKTATGASLLRSNEGAK